MSQKLRFAVLLLSITTLLAGQQPNTSNHSMTINGIDGAPFPILIQVRTSLPANFAFGTIPNQPYALYQGTLHQGAGFNFANGLVDLNLSPAPVKILDGFSNPTFHTDLTGYAAFTVNVPPAGSPPNGVPIGLSLAEQALVGDPFNSFGYSLTAATRILVSQGPIITAYSLGDDSEQPVSLTNMSIPFYGTNYTSITLGSNGYVCFNGTANSSFTPNPSEMLGGSPKMAAQWCDLVCAGSGVVTTIDTNPGLGNPPYMRVDYINASDFGIQIYHNFSMLMRADGYLEIISSPSNNASNYDQFVGIAAGNNLGGAAQAQKNFIGAQPPGSTVGPGILSTSPFSYVGAVNEAFYEWFGLLSTNPNYAAQQSYDNPYDLPAVTLHFAPTGTGNRYVLY